MFKKEKKTTGEYKPSMTGETERIAMEIAKNIQNTKVEMEQIDAGFSVGFGNAEKIYEKAINRVARESRNVKYENLILKVNNKSLAKENAKLLAKLKELGVSEDDLEDNGNSGDDSDDLSYFELFP
jgi:hypothetical protein|nr:MAG TPA: hypothetical protein [Caudoviricetes sp.]